MKKKSKVFKRSFAYNLGRISSYSIGGLFAGLLGSQFLGLSQNINAHLILQSIAALVLIALALNILGFSPITKITEAVGTRLWKRIQPLGKHLYPINSLSGARYCSACSGVGCHVDWFILPCY